MALFEPGKKFPDDESIERLAKYKRMAMIFDGKSFETYKRAVDILRKSGKREQADQLEALFTEITIIETLITKPADMLVGEKPTYDAKHDADAVGRKKVDEIAQNNDLDKLVHELVIGGGIRGDSWIKVRYGYRQDFTELLERALPIPQSAKLEPIIEHVFAPDVYPEVAPNNVKQFSAVNIAKVDEVSTGGILPKKEYYLDVERHLHGYIIRDRFRLKPSSANKEYGVAVATYLIGDRVQETQIEETGVDYMCVYHIPHKSLDDRWQGVGGIEKVEGIIRAIQDRFMQIDYILWKHSDPAMYAPPSDASELTHSSSGVIFEVEKDDITPGYMTWNSQLEAHSANSIIISAYFTKSSKHPTGYSARPS
ncbi:hypothetical protein JCM19037_1571 [Geomicrobium sp. JCM 19037]|uniref:phage portal protein n=1 Tax=Geomicrobium sp. JCM 19037 TaxID=1460634 RepID=UPI00045F37B3|nr:phage portal protein [Geomicrobium sp. JCM 19037]GAK03264.1 hypothetical protein JCM19037_1571 [Geomicrobium sp. JCM 19037]